MPTTRQPTLSSLLRRYLGVRRQHDVAFLRPTAEVSAVTAPLTPVVGVGKVVGGEDIIWGGEGMNAGSPVVMPERGTPTLAERATAILRDEIANGALGNIATASRVWSAHRRDLIAPEMTRRLAVELGGLLDAVLDLLAPPPLAAAQDPTAERGQQTIEPLPILRARRSVPPGTAAEIHTGLRNDGPTPVEVGFVWSDLVAEPDGRIHADCLRLLPGRVRIPPGAFVDLAIGLHVPHDARPGLYHALLQTTERVGLRALLTFPVLNVEREAPAAV